MEKKSHKVPGFGGRRQQLNIEQSRLFLDEYNPRLPEQAHGKSQIELLRILYNEFNLEELAYSMSNNGYFDEEPLVAYPRKLPTRIKAYSTEFATFIEKNSTTFTVVEGNRRLATVKLLLESDFRKKLNIKTWISPTKEIEKDLSALPTIIYPNRNEVTPYMGVRHIIGIQKWDSYARARYIAKMVKEGISLSDIENQIGDRQNSARKYYLCYKLAEIAEDEFDIDISSIKKDFSLLMLATGQGRIKEFLGLPKKLSDASLDKPISKNRLPNLKNLISWLYGNETYSPVIKESRDITNYLTHVVASKESTKFLITSRALIEAYELSDGEEQMLLRSLSTANKKLEMALGIAHRHKTIEVIEQIGKCLITATQLSKTVRDIDAGNT